MLGFLEFVGAGFVRIFHVIVAGVTRPDFGPSQLYFFLYPPPPKIILWIGPAVMGGSLVAGLLMVLLCRPILGPGRRRAELERMRQSNQMYIGRTPTPVSPIPDQVLAVLQPVHTAV